MNTLSRRIIHTLGALFVSVSLFLSSASGMSGISHIEYFAGNYADSVQRDPSLQFGVLFRTVDELIYRFGPQGTIYINDLSSLAAERASQALRTYLKTKGYLSIEILQLPGNILDIDPPKTKTAHLKNPEPVFLKKLAHPAERSLKEKFRRIIQASEGGLILDTYDLGLPPQDLANYLEDLRDEFGLTAVESLSYEYFDPRPGCIGQFMSGPISRMIRYQFPRSIGHETSRFRLL